MADATSTPPADRMVGFGEALPLFLKNYAVFSGRSSRGAYWWAGLGIGLISIAISIVDMVLFSGAVAAMNGTGPLAIVFSLATLIPNLAVAIRRLHDVGRSGWWLLIMFTIVGILVLLYWYVQPGQRSENKFGPDKEAGR